MVVIRLWWEYSVTKYRETSVKSVCWIPVLKVLWPSCFFRLVPGRRYYYKFGDDSFGWSDEFSFKAAPTPGPSVTTRVLAIGGILLVFAPLKLVNFVWSLCRFGSRRNRWKQASKIPGTLRSEDCRANYSCHGYTWHPTPPWGHLICKWLWEWGKVSVVHGINVRVKVTLHVCACVHDWTYKQRTGFLAVGLSQRLGYVIGGFSKLTRFCFKKASCAPL